MFEHWARVTAGVLEFGGVPGFLANATEFYDASDGEGAAWRALVDLWWERHRDAEVGVGDLWKIVGAEDGEQINLNLGSGSERSQRTRFGLLLTQQRDRQYDNHRIVAAGKRRGAQQWRLQTCEPSEP